MSARTQNLISSSWSKLIFMEFVKWDIKARSGKGKRFIGEISKIAAN